MQQCKVKKIINQQFNNLYMYKCENRFIEILRLCLLNLYIKILIKYKILK
jgi:hypothetical protein